MPEKYCLTFTQRHDLYNLLIEWDVIKPIKEADFHNCFDLNNCPDVTPIYQDEQQIKMVRVLSQIMGEREKPLIAGNIMVTHFGINYDSYKSQKYILKTNNTIEPVFDREIKKIINKLK